MKKSSLISIIVPVYNVEKYLCRCVNSLLKQTYHNLEIILVNDGSPDNCPYICDKYAEQDSRIKVIHKSNGGLSSARNAALDVMNGDYVFFLDSDDYLHCETLTTMLDIANQYNAELVQCSYFRGKKDVFPNIKIKRNVEIYLGNSIFYSNKQNIIVCGKLYSSKLWQNVRMPVGRVNEDDFTTWKLYYKADKIVVTKSKFYYYYDNENSITASQKKKLKLDFVDAYKERIAFFYEKNEVLLTKISQWRFCLPLLNACIQGSLTKEEKAFCRKLFEENACDAIKCSKVKLSHRLLISGYLYYPSIIAWIYRIIMK
ncbi:glycosyl transferase family 2 [Bacteroides coprosuis DSM 18011]|uniref:Glycosyl transferase family 2 n=1 Tax=Bacteroides coprosuis DSM 18011 TaxID=679937 RepID=F3ZS26_9BACE|nr:glycosyltransferase family 2 protein [Bacteroides coprosuis]EGJ72047.1 glycosyl transferase family 2 [Bacteroides coprosuis DSM 18011]